MRRKGLALAILGLLASPGVFAQKPRQYLVRTSTAEYQIRQPKPSEQGILPANTPIQFTVDKDLMKFKLNGKKYEFRIVGSSALQSDVAGSSKKG